jgi:flagellar protein FlgJ
MKIDGKEFASQELAPKSEPKENEKLMKVAKGFENMFVQHLVGEMRKTVQRGDLVPESQAERIYRSMLDNEYSQKMSDTGQLGLSKLIYDHLLRESRGR